MRNKLGILCLTALLNISAQATELKHPFEPTDDQIDVCNYCPKTLYRSPIKVAFSVKGNDLRGETVCITGSDARSVLLPHNWYGGKFCEEAYAVMPGAKIKNLEEPEYVNYNDSRFSRPPVNRISGAKILPTGKDTYNLPNCYDNIFGIQMGYENIGLDETSKIVKTYNFGNASNLNGVSIKIGDPEAQNIWSYGCNEWSAEFDFYPWSPGVLSYSFKNEDWKNKSFLCFEIEGYIAGISLPKHSSIHPYLVLINSTDFKEALMPDRGGFATVCFDGNFKNTNSLYNRLSPSKLSNKK